MVNMHTTPSNDASGKASDMRSISTMASTFGSPASTR